MKNTDTSLRSSQLGEKLRDNFKLLVRSPHALGQGAFSSVALGALRNQPVAIKIVNAPL